MLFLLSTTTGYGESPLYKNTFEIRSKGPIMISNSIGYEDNIYTSCLTPDGKRLVKCIGDENRVVFFDISGEGLEDELSDFDLTLPTPCPVIRISKDGKLLSAGGGWNKSAVAPAIHIINISTQKVDLTINAPHQYFEMSHDGKYVVTNNQDLNCAIYWISNGSKMIDLYAQYQTTKFSPDNKHLAVYNSENDGYIEIFQFPQLSRVFLLPGNANFSLCPNRSNMFSWSKNGEFLAITFATENIIKILDSSTWQVVRELTPKFENHNYTSSAFSPSEDLLAIGTSVWYGDNISLGVQIYDTQAWSIIHDESEFIDYQEDILDVLVTTSEYYNNAFLFDRYPIFDSMTWRPDGSIYLSVTMYDGSKPLNPNIKLDEPAKGPPSNNNESIPLALILSIVLIVIISSLAILFYYRPYQILSPLYSKLHPDDLENQVTRKNILQFIQTHPGCIFSEIKKSLKGSYSNFYYHITVLEREHLIFYKFAGLRRQLYSSNYPKFSKLFPQIEHQGLHEQIFILLLSSPGLTQKEIASKLNVSEPTVSRYILDLLMEDFIWRERDGKVWKCYSNPFTEAQA